MARPKKSTSYTADASTIEHYFDEAMALKNSQSEVTSEISAHNAMMQRDGVHAGLLSHYTKIARMKPEKAALWLALDDFYRQALASRLPNPAKAEAETHAVPFGKRTAA